MSLHVQDIFSVWKKFGLSRQVLSWLALAGIIPFLLLVLPQYFFAESALVTKEKQALDQALEARVYQVEKWLDNIRQDLDFIAESNCARGLCPHSTGTEEFPSCTFQEAVPKSHRAYRAIHIYTSTGELLSRSGDGGACLSFPSKDFLARISARKSDYFVVPAYCFEGDSTFVTVGKRNTDAESSYSTYVLASLNLHQAIDALFTNPFLASGKFYIITRNGQYLYPPGGDPKLQAGMIRNPEQFLAGNSGEIREYHDSGGQTVLGVFRPIAGTEWLLVKEVDKDVIIKSRQTFAQRSLLAGIITLVVIFFGSVLIARRLGKPLDELALAAKSISLGETGNWLKAPESGQWEVNQVAKAFNDMQDRLRDSEKALVKAASLAAIGEFSAKIVHDIRSPLSSINLALASLAKSDLGDKERERLDIAREQARRLMNMADGVLSYGKPLQLNSAEITLGKLLDELVEVMAPALAEKELDLHLPSNGSLEISFQGDRELLLQALTDLLNNASQWSPNSGVIEIEGSLAGSTGRDLLLRIADSGPGFNEKSLAKVFQPFFTTRKKGTGLGLANAKKIIDYHGGSISAANRPGGGAEIIITLPLQRRSVDA